MTDEKDKNKWPEYTSWWDRNEFTINVVLWITFFILLIMGRLIFSKENIELDIAILWMTLFILDLFLLSFTSNGVHK